MDNPQNPKLLERKEFIDIIFDAFPTPVYCTDADGRVICANKALVDVFGISKSDVESHTEKSLSGHPASDLMAGDLRVIATGKVQKDLLLSCRTAAGEKTMRVWKVPLRDFKDRPMGLICFAIDRTDVVQMQESLRRNEEKYRNFFKTSADCVYITSVDGRTQEFNESAREMFGYTHTEMTQIPVASLYAEAIDRQRLMAAIAENGSVHRYPVNMRRKDGCVFPAQITAVVVRGANGEVVAYQGTIHDVSRLKQAQEEQVALETELRQARKMEAVARMAEGIAHDFNNLLTAIMGGIELARQTAGGSPLQHLTRAYHSCMDARELVLRFLQFSDSDLPPKTPEGISGMIRQAVDARSGPNAAADYQIFIPDDLHPVNFIAAHMLQVFENLLSNAENAMPSGGTVAISAENITLSASAASEAPSLPPGPYVKISIIDTGAGIAPEHQDQIFDPYFSTQQRDSDRGRGLGLTIVYAIIKRHSGDIRVQSAPGEGTTVSIFLPAVQ